MSESFILQGGEVLLPDGNLVEAAVEVRGGKISAVRPDAAGMTGTVIRTDGKIVVPGFIDVHIHGGGGGDWMDLSRDQYRRILGAHTRFGTTGLLATTLTMPFDDLRESARLISSMMRDRASSPAEGANILGIHFEGPYINKDYKGAQNPDYIQPISRSAVEELYESAEGAMKWITLAPEASEESDEAIEYLTGHGVVCSVGHSGAGHSELCRCMNKGLSHVTHLYNGMAPFRHREPGIIDTALGSDGLTVEVIADGIHSSVPALRMAVKAKGTGKVLLITDAIRATGMPDGEYNLGGQTAYVREGVARLAGGSLAGSTLTMNRAVAFMAEQVGVRLEEALAMASAIPADKLGLGDRKGRVAEGYDADLLVVDRSVNIHLTMVDGTIAHREGV